METNRIRIRQVEHFNIIFLNKNLLWLGKKRMNMGCNLCMLRNVYFYLMFFSVIYCLLSPTLIFSCVEHLRNCHAKSSMNNKAILFYPNDLNLNLLLLILFNCWGRFILSVYFWKMYILKLKFLGLLFTGSLIRIVSGKLPFIHM